MHYWPFLTLLWMPLVFALGHKRSPPFPSTSIHLGDYTHSHESIEDPTFTCSPIGECEVCSDIEKKTMPYCMDYGNKEPVQCKWDDPEYERSNSNNQSVLYGNDLNTLPSYRACPRVQSIERWKVIKFESVNLVVAVGSFLVFFWRQRKLAREQYQRMAQRIGISV